MTQKHTPGPWLIKKTYCNVHEVYPAIDENQRIAKVSLSNCETWSGAKNKDEANAALIAAAPDLLEALEYLMTDIKKYWGEEKGGASHPKYFDHSMSTARQAIAKAEGRE